MKTLFQKSVVLILCFGLLFGLGACGSQSTSASGDAVGSSDKKTIRIGHNQATNHPTHIALEAFKEYIESNLADKYEVEIYPSELLGSQDNMVQLTQMGAIDMCVAKDERERCNDQL